MGNTRIMPNLEGSIMPKAKFLQDLYLLALARYQLAGKFAKDKTILDIGCGSGYGSQTLIDNGAKKVYGVDLAKDSIDYCKKHHSHRNLTFQQGDITQLVFKDNFFDLICVFETIEHVKDYQKAIQEIYRVLKPGGMLFISTPNKAVYSPDTKKPFYPFHYHEFYLKDLKNMLKPFKVKKIQGQFIKGKKMLQYSPWNPKRWVRIFYANLPFVIKIGVTRSYLKIYHWLYQTKILRPNKIQLSDVYLSDNLTDTRVLVAICEKKSNHREKRK